MASPPHQEREKGLNMWLFLAFLLVPVIEIALFIQVGGAIGLWLTLAIVILTAIVGTMMVKSQGRLVLAQVQQSFHTLNDPSEPLAHGAMILFSGALLLTPGFFTDAVGFALLFPPVRAAVFHWAKRNIKIQTVHTRRQHNETIIEGEFTEVNSNRTDPSGWTRH
jgi:UPF0716 protein FxsA